LEIFVEKVEEVRRVEGDRVEALELWMKSGKLKVMKIKKKNFENVG
jgi:hypothetical protein